MLKDALKRIETSLKEVADINLALDETLCVAITDIEGIITFVNDKFCHTSKFTKEELLGQDHRIINSGYHSKVFFKNMWQTIVKGNIWRGDIRNKAKDGTMYWMDTTIVPCLNNLGQPYQYVSFRIDITERKHAEEYLGRFEKIASVGQLASGIAHEIRNPLAAIKMSVHLIQTNHSADHPIFNSILSELDRIDMIISEFLLLAKPHDAKFQERNIVGLLEMVLTLMNIQARRNNIYIRLKVVDEIPTIRCEENQIKQVFVNIIKNAIEAMPNGGDILIYVYAENNCSVKIRFVDEGCGIPDTLLCRLGEPFYTTKEKGTGLGLQVCRKIIEDHQGTMKISSEVDKGTTIDVILPVLSGSTTV